MPGNVHLAANALLILPEFQIEAIIPKLKPFRNSDWAIIRRKIAYLFGVLLVNRTDRLLAIVLELQARGHRRAEDLAATFEVSKRTIYRDILALCESGVPVISMPGSGYSLVEGYFLPPLSFSTDEAIMLLLGSDFVAQNFDAQYRTAAYSASRKIEVVLPAALRDEVHYLQRSIRFVVGNASVIPEILHPVRRAIIQRRTVRFDYQARSSADAQRTARMADPYALIHLKEAWYMVAYCHLRHDKRSFRLERISNLTVLDKTFIRPADFRIEERSQGERTLTVRALFDPETAPWVRESPSFFQVDAADQADGLLVTFRVRQEDEIVQWLLGWGARVRVLEPESLQERLSQEAKAILQSYPQTRQKS